MTATKLIFSKPLSTEKEKRRQQQAQWLWINEAELSNILEWLKDDFVYDYTNQIRDELVKNLKQSHKLMVELRKKLEREG